MSQNHKVNIDALIKALEAGGYNAAPSELVQGSGTYFDLNDLPPIVFDPSHIKKKSCECGAHKLGMKAYGPGHSDWCPVKAKS